jgi:predicted ATP-grasp superfamily ATP-dependent carboligase
MLALVTGIGGPAGRATTRFLRNQGVRIIGTDIVRVEADVDEFHIVPRGDSADFADALLELISTTISRTRDTIRALGANLFIGDPFVVDVANDKLMTARILDAAGIPVPKTLADCSPDIAAREIKYPLIVKPRVGRGGRGVSLYYSEYEARNETRADTVWQDYMPGDEYDLNLFAYPAGFVRTLAVLRKTAMKQGPIGNALHVQRVIRRDVAGLGLRVARSLSLEGPVDMDIRMDRAGKPRVLEINARVGANILSSPEILEILLMTASEGVYA